MHSSIKACEWYQHFVAVSKPSYSLDVVHEVHDGVTISAGLLSYPIDTVRRRMHMMMTSGEAVKYTQGLV